MTRVFSGGICSALLLTFALLAPLASAQQTLYDIGGASNGESYGSGITVTPDLDGDATPDFLVSSPLYHVPAIPVRSGRVSLVSGATGSQIWTSYGSTDSEHLHVAHHLGLDANSDGTTDLLLGAPEFTGHAGQERIGILRVHSGTDGTPIPGIEIRGKIQDERFGSAFTSLVDFDADGNLEFAVAARLSSGVLPYAGAVRIYNWNSGAPTEAFQLDGAARGDRFGTVLLADDSYFATNPTAALLVGAPLADGTDVNSGLVYVYRHPFTAPHLVVSGEHDHDLFGAAITTCPDQTADGIRDLLIGAPRHDANAGQYDQVKRGRVYLIDGSSGSTIRAWDGEADGDRFGFTVAFLGDFDGNAATPDHIAIGAPGWGTTQFGRLYIYPITSTTPTLVVDGDSSEQAFASTCRAIGSLTADGTPDLLVGSPHDLVNSVRLGSVLALSN